MSAGLFEYWLRLTLAKIIAEAAEAVAPGIVVELNGERAAADSDAEEWLALDIFKAKRDRQRLGSWIGSVMFQVSVFSRHGAFRRNGKIERPAELAGLLVDQLRPEDSGSIYIVKDYDNETPAERGQVNIPEPETERLDERDIAQSNQLSVPAAVHGLALTFEAQANNY